jgi:YjbE family integral membrane protein
VEAVWADFALASFWIGVGKIIGINVVLSGDNAVVIALACRMLAPRQRFWGMVLGAGVAVLLRVLFTLVVAQAMEYSYLKLAGGMLLLWVAVKLMVPEEPGPDGRVEAASNLWRAIRIVAIADIVMSLDNVIAIAATAETAAAAVDVAQASLVKALLIVLGLTTSIPMIVAGSALLMLLLERYPVLVWAGAGLLGWVAGDVMIKDDALIHWFPASTIETLHRFSVYGLFNVNIAALAGAGFVVAVGYVMMRRRREVTETGDV